MYKTDFVCTYKAFEELADDDVKSDMLYRAQFLQVFGLTEYNDRAISAGLEQIKTLAADVPELRALILQHPYSYHNDNDNDTDTDDKLEGLLPLMFAYPLLDVFHLCLIDVFKTGSISKQDQDKVLRAYDTMLPN
jgi:hypothetical protein